MANFSATLSFQTIGLCQSLKITDTSNYGSNDEGYTESNVQSKKFIVRYGSFYMEKTVAANVYEFDVPISLLDLNIIVELIILIGPGNSPYGIQVSQIVPCIGI